jgi:hypothetical protein
MSGADTVVVTQADKALISDFWDAFKAAGPVIEGADAGRELVRNWLGIAARHRIATQSDALAVMREAYRTMDESGSPEAAGTVAWNWIGDMAQVLREADAVHVEITSEPLEGGGRVTRLYRGSTVMAVATTFRDVMNFTVFVPWVSPTLANLRAAIARAGGAE